MYAPQLRTAAAASSVWIGLVFFQIRREPTYSLLNTGSLHSNHSGEQALGALGSTSSKMALAALGSDQFSGAGQAESLGGSLVCFEFVLLYFALLCHPNYL